MALAFTYNSKSSENPPKCGSPWGYRLWVTEKGAGLFPRLSEQFVQRRHDALAFLL